MFLLYSFLFFIFRTSAEFLLRRAGYLCPRTPQLCDTSLLCQTRIGRGSLDSDSLNFNTRDQAGATVPTGPLYPLGPQGYGGTGVLGHRNHWGTVGTGGTVARGPLGALYPPQGYSGLGHRWAGYRSTAQPQLYNSDRPATALTTEPPKLTESNLDRSGWTTGTLYH
jgi:hypothetical protein